MSITTILLGWWIAFDVAAHLSNYLGSYWITMVPFEYGTEAYELTGATYWGVGLTLWALNTLYIIRLARR